MTLNSVAVSTLLYLFEQPNIATLMGLGSKYKNENFNGTTKERHKAIHLANLNKYFSPVAHLHRILLFNANRTHDSVSIATC